MYVYDAKIVSAFYSVKNSGLNSQKFVMINATAFSIISGKGYMG